MFLERIETFLETTHL